MYDEVPVDIGVYEPNGNLEFLLVLAVFAAFGLGVLLGWWLLRQRRDKKLDTIYREIRNKAHWAAVAQGGKVISEAQELLQVIEQHLGATRRLVGGLNGPIKKINDALTGALPPTPGSQPAQANLSIGSTGGLGVTFPATITPTPPAPPPSTLQHHIESVGDAVQAFYDHWNQRQARMAELRNAQRELL